MRAILSDIHANIDALIAVMNDIETQNVRSVICLGDIVGYGPDGGACIDNIMRNASITLMGNHDHAMVHRPFCLNPIAAELLLVSRDDKLSSHPCGQRGKGPRCLLGYALDVRWEFIENLPDAYQEGKIAYIHGSPSDPLFGYIFPDRFRTGWEPRHVQKQFGMVEGIAFCGHTHIPCLITDNLACVYPSDRREWLEFDTSKKYLVNVGSVGQPRDGDTRACYALFDENAMALQWRRIPYDVSAAIKKITALCGEHAWCADRLALGK